MAIPFIKIHLYNLFQKVITNVVEECTSRGVAEQFSMCKHLCEGAYSSRAGGGSGRVASPLPRVKKISKNTNEMVASEDVESTIKSRISSVFMLIFSKIR